MSRKSHVFVVDLGQYQLSITAGFSDRQSPGEFENLEKLKLAEKCLGSRCVEVGDGAHIFSIQKFNPRARMHLSQNLKGYGILRLSLMVRHAP